MSTELSFDMQTPFLRLPNNGGYTEVSVNSACTSFLIVGTTGSGKTTSSGALIANNLLKLGCGGLVLTAKASDTQLWLRYIEQTGRSQDVIMVQPGGNHSFDFLQYISDSSQSKAAYAANIVHVLTTVIRSAEAKEFGKTEDSSFWESSLTLLITSAVELSLLAYKSVSVRSLYDIVTTAPKADSDRNNEKETAFTRAFTLAQDYVNVQIDAFEKSASKEWLDSYATKESYEAAIIDAIPDAATFHLVDQFFIDSYCNLSEKTRSIIEFSFIGFLLPLLKEPVRSLFCNNSCTFTPEDTINNKIIILNLPIKKYYKVGRDLQVLFKYIFQLAIEKRNIDNYTKPIFIYSDEFSNFLHEFDSDFLSSARSSRIISCLITQNLPNLYAGMGGAQSENRIKSLLGNIGIKIFHCNADVDTNNYASQLCGKGYTEDVSRTVTMAGEFSSSNATSYSLEDFLRPEELQVLRNGGPPNKFIAEAYVHLQGQQFLDGLPFCKIAFAQNLK